MDMHGLPHFDTIRISHLESIGLLKYAFGNRVSVQSLGEGNCYPCSRPLGASWRVSPDQCDYVTQSNGL